MWNFGTYVDGTNNHSKWLTLQRAPQLGSSGFAIETVKEVQLITNQFSAEFGGHSAGVASMITKSGTNSVNGSAFVMIRPGDWDADAAAGADVEGARTTSSSSAAPLGGPIVQDKVFFFGSYERRRERSQVVVTSPEASGPVVPTPADEHQGHVQGRRPLHRQELARRALQHGALEEGQRERRLQPARHRLHLGQQRRHRARHVH